MDIRFINPFLEAVQTVFKTMLATDTMIGKPFLKSDDDGSDAEVYAVIGISGDAAGSVLLAFPKGTGLKIASQLSGEEMGIDHPDLGDALGEVLNMVAGHAKSKFEGLNCSISLPKVLIGKEMQTLDSKETTLVLPCDSTLGRFRVEVALREENKAAAAA